MYPSYYLQRSSGRHFLCTVLTTYRTNEGNTINSPAQDTTALQLNVF